MTKLRNQPDRDGEQQTAMTMPELCESMFDYDLKVERAIHVQSMLASPASDLEEQIEDGGLDCAAVLLGFTADDLVRGVKDDELGWMLRNATGWIVEASAAMHGPWSKGNHRCRRSYPGMRTLQWFNGGTYEQALEGAVRWVQADPPELLWPQS